MLLFLTCFAIRCSNASFNLLDGFDTTIQDAFGVSSKCLSAVYVCCTVALLLVNMFSVETQRLLAMRQPPRWPRKEWTKTSGINKK
jgi:hypothetical protein